MFGLDKRIASTAFLLGEWPLSQVLLKNEAHYPWFLLVPKKDNIQEIFHLAKDERDVFMEEINQLSLIVNSYFKPDKLNIGALGNVVAQLHVHVIARKKTDALWPQSIWQTAIQSTLYEEKKLKILLPDLQNLVNCSGKDFK